jgi:hypothetical protein
VGEFLFGVLGVLGDILAPTRLARWFIAVLVAMILVGALMYFKVLAW